MGGLVTERGRLAKIGGEICNNTVPREMGVAKMVEPSLFGIQNPDISQ
jgi:hypothetical protein